MEKPVSVGRTDCTGKVFRFSTVADAETAISLLETVIPVSVHAGDYYIDAPEELVNPSSNKVCPRCHKESETRLCGVCDQCNTELNSR